MVLIPRQKKARALSGLGEAFLAICISLRNPWALEAIAGLILEGVFIAMLIQRFLGSNAQFQNPLSLLKKGLPWSLDASTSMCFEQQSPHGSFNLHSS